MVGYYETAEEIDPTEFYEFKAQSYIVDKPDIVDWDARGQKPYYSVLHKMLSESTQPRTAFLFDESGTVESIFNDLANKWKTETWFMSSMSRRISNLAYLQIIGLGKPALPLIFQELRREPDHWFYALEAITREDPAPANASLGEITEAWLRWSAQHGF
jgi:hypothetical protein